MQTYSQINEEQTEKPSILGILTSPSLQFKRLKTQRNIFLPLTVLILLIIASSALFSWNSLNNPSLIMYNSGTGSSVSKKVQFLTSFGITAISCIAALFFIHIFYKNVMIFWGVDIKYKETLCIIIYSSFVLRLGMLLNGLIAFYLNAYEISYTGLGAIVTNNMILHAIAQE